MTPKVTINTFKTRVFAALKTELRNDIFVLFSVNVAKSNITDALNSIVVVEVLGKKAESEQILLENKYIIAY